jgi:hypothetical protein
VLSLSACSVPYRTTKNLRRSEFFQNPPRLQKIKFTTIPLQNIYCTGVVSSKQIVIYRERHWRVLFSTHIALSLFRSEKRCNILLVSLGWLTSEEGVRFHHAGFVLSFFRAFPSSERPEIYTWLGSGVRRPCWFRSFPSSERSEKYTWLGSRVRRRRRTLYSWEPQ